MELAQSTLMKNFIVQASNLEKLVESAGEGKSSKPQLEELQAQLDELAKKYQHNEAIGSAVYRLYEMQALIHYYSGSYDEAIDFINQAIESRGGIYAKAIKIKDEIEQSVESAPRSHNRKSFSHSKKLDGLEGWLALLTVGIGLGAIYNLIQLMGYPAAFQDYDAIRSEAPGLVSAVLPVLWFEIVHNIALITAAISFVYLAVKRRRVAVTLGLVIIIGTPIISYIDYVWAKSVFDQYNVPLDDLFDETVINYARNLIFMFLWVPYLLYSRRVKDTLTR